MPTVRISSMYDLQTNTKFGVIGVHTPSAGQIISKYDGLARNYKFMKVKKCSVKIACASVLPADPLQVGVTAGKISPADMMNPILYRAVSNDSWNDVVSRIYTSGWNGDSADGIDDAFFTTITQDQSEKIYYSLLSSPGWRKVMPQQGLSVKNLRPLVHEVVSVFGNTLKANLDVRGTYQLSDDLVAGVNSGGNPTLVADRNVLFRGRTLPMPAIPTATIVGGDTPSVDNAPAVPKTMVLAIVMPFSQLQVMYYRMIVTWDIVFFGLRPATEISLSTAITDGAYCRYSRWTVSSSKELESDDQGNVAESVGCVDALNMSPELKMEA